MPDGAPWPRVSIVTPSYNQAQFIEETIRSVLLQGYPDLEYIIIDGGSTDGSVEIIRKYEPWLAYWVSEKDRGQSEAINKGFARATGEIVAWLNSDDTYCPDAISQSTITFHNYPEVGVVHGDCDMVSPTGELWHKLRGRDSQLENVILCDVSIPQPSVFFKHMVYDVVGPLNTELHYVMDFDLWLKMWSHFPTKHVSQVWSTYRMSDHSKSVSQVTNFLPEVAEVVKRGQGFHCPTIVIREAYRRALFRAGVEFALHEQYREATGYFSLAMAEFYFPYESLKKMVFYTLGRMESSAPWETILVSVEDCINWLLLEMGDLASRDVKAFGQALSTVWNYRIQNLKQCRKSCLAAMRLCSDKKQILWLLSYLLKSLLGESNLRLLRKVKHAGNSLRSLSPMQW